MDTIQYLEEAADYWKGVYETSEMKSLVDTLSEYEQGEIKEIKFSLTGELFERAMKLSKNNAWTSYVLMMAFLRISLRLCTKEDGVIGIPSHFKSTEAEVQNVCLPLVCDVTLDATFKEILLSVKKEIETLHKFQTYVLDEKNQIAFHKEKGYIFPVNAVVKGLHREELVSKYQENNDIKLSFCLNGCEDHYDITIRYNTEYYKNENMIRFVKKFQLILEQCLSDPDKKLDDIKLIPEDEEIRIHNVFNATDVPFDREKSLAEVFEEQVRKSKDKIAVECGTEKITYEALNARANTIANVLRERGVLRDSTVPIMVKRSIDTIVCMVAVLKAGAGYIPIDTEYPKDRIAYMLEHSKVEVMITQHAYEEELSQMQCEKIFVDEPFAKVETNENPKPVATANDLCYVLFTSGSTGKPKGVMINQLQMHNFFISMKEMMDFEKYHNMLSLTTVSFDIFELESMTALLGGQKITLCQDGEDIDGERIAELIEESNIEIIQCTPSRVKILLESKEFQKALRKVKVMVLGGESFPESHREVLESFDNLSIYNLYGPTETTIYSSGQLLTKESDITVGKPFANTRYYIMNEDMKELGFGEEGEICIAGDCVGRGYLNNDNLTQERFVVLDNGERIYHSGDLGKWREDGEVDFCGRIDFQVKIRGYRVELGEIQSTMLEVPGVKEALVVARGKNAEKELYAYYIENAPVDQKELKAYLEKKLPDYMVPAYFMKLDEIPLTLNGKVDRKKLPEIKMVASKEYVAPQSEEEKVLIKIVQEVLNVDQIGVEDSFFELGGNSMKATLLATKIKKVGYYLNVKDVMKGNNIQKMAVRMIKM